MPSRVPRSWWEQHRRHWALFTDRSPPTAQSSPPTLGKAMLTDTTKNVSHRLNPTAKEQYRSKGGVDEVLGRGCINLIPLTEPILPTGSTTTNSPAVQTAPPDLNGAAAKKGLHATGDRAARSAKSVQVQTQHQHSKAHQKSSTLFGLKGRPKSKNKVGRNSAQLLIQACGESRSCFA